MVAGMASEDSGLQDLETALYKGPVKADCKQKKTREILSSQVLKDICHINPF